MELSGSQLGMECLRALWYEANGADKVEISESTRRIFDMGNALEAVAVKWMKREGKDVFYNQKAHGDPPDFALELGEKRVGRIVGRFDAIVNKNTLIDIKACGDRLFLDIVDRAEKGIEPPHDYWVQLNVYFFGLKMGCLRDDIASLVSGLEKVGLYAIHRGTGESIELIRKPDVEVFQHVVEKALKVFSAESVEELEMDKSKCNWCRFREVCKR